MPEVPKWVSIVRTANLAEAGYLANELETGGFDSQIHQHDSFSAVDGSWTTLFLIQVPLGYVQQAADHLRAYLAEADQANSLAGAESCSDDAADRDAVVWRPIALMIVAGAAILFIGYKMRELRALQHEPPSRAGLLHVLEQIDRPFISENPAHAPNRFRLYFSRQGQVWRLQEDIDGDGRYDREWRFREAALDN